MFQDTGREKIHRIQCTDNWNTYVQCKGNNSVLKENLSWFFFSHQSRMRLTSTYLQRWMASWIAYIILWCGDYILYWISHHSTVLDILEFLIPLALLFITTSAFAEVNFEGERMIQVCWNIKLFLIKEILRIDWKVSFVLIHCLVILKFFYENHIILMLHVHVSLYGACFCLQCIFPTKDRMKVQAFLRQQPLQMKASVIYNVINCSCKCNIMYCIFMLLFTRHL